MAFVRVYNNIVAEAGSRLMRMFWVLASCNLEVDASDSEIHTVSIFRTEFTI